MGFRVQVSASGSEGLKALSWGARLLFAIATTIESAP